MLCKTCNESCLRIPTGQLCVWSLQTLSRTRNQIYCDEHTTQVKHLSTFSNKKHFPRLTGHLEKQNEHPDIPVYWPALSLRGSEFIYYCLSEFNALLKCNIICKDSELASIRANGIILCAFSSSKNFDLYSPGESDP